MRLALPGSVLVHVGLLGVLLAGFAWPQAEDAAAPAPVTVNIVPMANVSSNSTEIVESDSTVSALSAGQAAETLEAEPVEVLAPVEAQVNLDVPEMVEQIDTRTIDPVEPESVREAHPSETIEAEMAPAVEPVNSAETALPLAAAEPVELAELSSTAVSALNAAPIEPAALPPDSPEPMTPSAPTGAVAPEPVESVAAQTLEPSSVSELAVAPVPHTLTAKRPSVPIVHKPAVERQPPGEPRATPKTSGNGGASQADAVAAAGGGHPQASNQGSDGQAEKARYQSMVQNRLRQSMTRYNGRGGSVVVSFTILPDGRIRGVRIDGTTDPSLTQAATALVQRAAPFPPIPPETGLSAWPFQIPLTFKGR